MNVEKVLAIVASIPICIVLCVIFLTPPATGYEISIYDAYPAHFWFSMIALIACGITILLRQAFAEKKSEWRVGLAIIIFANTIFLLLPAFRGYALYGRHDTLVHLGHIRDILVTGHFGESNFYPIVHILGNILIQLTGLPLESIPYLFFVLFSGILILNMHLLARASSNRFGQALLITALASPLIYSFFHVSIHPSFLSLFMVPCLLYFYQQRERLPYGKRQHSALLVLMAFPITFFHPLTALFVMLTFLTFGFARTLYSHLVSRKTAELTKTASVGKNFLGISLIMLLTFSIWYFSFSFIQGSVKSVYDWLISQIGYTTFQSTIEPLAEASLTQVQTFELFMKRVGAIFLLLFISGIACISVLRKGLSRKSDVEPVKFAYATIFLVALFVGIAMFFGFLVPLHYDPVRVSRFALLIGTVLCGLEFYDLIQRISQKNANKDWASKRSWTILVMGVTIMGMVVLSMGSIYRSPFTFSPSAHVTQMEIAGNEWFGRSKADIAVAANIPGHIRPFEKYIFGVDSSSVIPVKVAERLPSHFGYDQHDQIAEAFDFQDRYLFIIELDKVGPMFFPENVRPKIHQYTEEDFAKLESDPTIIKLYCNDEFEVWMTSGRGND